MNRILGLTVCFAGLSEASEAQAVRMDGGYRAEVVSNFTGGLKRGTRFNGLGQLGVETSSDSLGWWRGGRGRASVMWSQGGGASASLIGDDQTVSNIEAGNHVFVEELWLSQQMGRFTLTVGLQDLNTHYAVCPGAFNFLNSSFGIMPTLAVNFSSPVYPLTGLGVDVSYRAGEDWTWRAAVFDGEVTDFEGNPHNMTWSLGPGEGCLVMAEGIFAERLSLGSFYHTGRGAYGFYGSLTQRLWQRGERSVEAFLQGSYAQRSRSELPGYLGAGVSACGVCSSKGRDWLGLAFAHAFQKGQAGETSLELSYRYKITSHVILQPDCQCVLHPGGGSAHIPTSVAGSIRISFTF